MDIYLNALTIVEKHREGINEIDLANAMTEGSLPECWEAIHHLKSIGEINDLGGRYKITSKGRERLRVDSAAAVERKRNAFIGYAGLTIAVAGVIYKIIDLLLS